MSKWITRLGTKTISNSLLARSLGYDLINIMMYYEYYQIIVLQNISGCLIRFKTKELPKTNVKSVPKPSISISSWS